MAFHDTLIAGVSLFNLIAVALVSAEGVSIQPRNPWTGSTLVFTEDFESGNLDQWTYQACPGGVTFSTSYARTGSHSANFTVSDGDTHAKCSNVPTENPRAQILTKKALFNNNDEYYIAFSTLFPPKFPKPPSWFQVAEFYGPPFGGPPTMGIDLCNGNYICFEVGGASNASIWQSTAIVQGQWRDLVFHIKFSTDPNIGFAEIWDGGKQQTLKNGQTRYYYQTLNSSINWDGKTPNFLYLNQYRNRAYNMSTVTLFHDSVKVGTTLDSVMS